MKLCRPLLGVLTLVLAFTNAKADQVTVLGTASTYGVLAASSITSSGSTVVHGDLGLYSGTSVTGFLPGTILDGSQNVDNANAEQAIADAQAGFTYLSGLSSTENLSGMDLGGLTLGAGVYSFDTTAALNGNLILDFGRLSNTEIVFEVGTTFITSSGSSITVINQGTNNNVFYVVGTSASLGADSVFAGDILAGASVGLGTGASSSCGSLVALTGAVTLLTNDVNNCSSTGSDVTPFSSFGGTSPTPTPEPSSLIMLATGLAGGVRFLRKKTAAT